MSEGIELAAFLADVAASIERIDHRRPQAQNARTGVLFQAGIGPHSDSRAIELIVHDLALAERRRLGCAEDDLLDAFAALWTARRIVSGEAVTVPVQPQRDRFDLPMEMLA